MYAGIIIVSFVSQLAFNYRLFRAYCLFSSLIGADIPTPIRVIGFSLYGSMAASHRVRLGQYQLGLRESGIELEIHSLLDNSYLISRSEGRMPSISDALIAGFKRLKILTNVRRFHAAIVYCELFPFLPSWFEHTLLRVPCIYDFDDAWYLRYQTGNLKSLGFLLGGKFNSAISRASAITAGSKYLATYAEGFNSDVTYLPSVVDTNRFRDVKVRKNSLFTIGWIGSASTSNYLTLLAKVLRKFRRERAFRFVVVGGKAPKLDDVEVVEFPWTHDTEVDLINSFDVGLMPLPDDEWARGKCAFKLVQYMSCALPVIASHVGANIELVTEECGFLVKTDEEWIEALKWLHDNPRERQIMGAHGRARVKAGYSVESNLPILTQVIRKVVV